MKATGQLPLVIEPASESERSLEHLEGWLRAERDSVTDKLRDHGAILLRGFAVESAADFERIARTVDPHLKKDYLGTSPRDALTEYVFSASELPPYYPIPQHCEMSFTGHPPRRLFFHCMIAPTSPGGETPLADFRKVARDLPAEVRDRFERRGVRNIRNYCGPQGGSRFDLWKLKRWDEMFRTEDHAVVESKCRENGFDFDWRPGGRLRLTNVQPALRQHPETGESVWFNHSQVFHISSAPAEYRRILRRQPEMRLGLLSAFARVAVGLKQRLTPVEDLAMHSTYGDGTPIPEADMEAVRDAIWKNMVFTRWQKTDVVVIDNFSVAHGRMPYRGPRKVTVSWA